MYFCDCLDISNHSKINFVSLISITFENDVSNIYRILLVLQVLHFILIFFYGNLSFDAKSL